METLKKLESAPYDLLIMDISMPDRSGLDILKIIKDKSLEVPVLISSVHAQEQYAIRAFNLGATGYLCKNSVYDELETAIKTILAGKKYISHELAEKIIFDKPRDRDKTPHEKLSTREFQIMCLLAKGKSVKEIAGELCISDKTVSTHRMRLLQKMDFTKNAELTHYAIMTGLIE
jgi:DNA-binding NarL/FixJ family response regulator